MEAHTLTGGRAIGAGAFDVIWRQPATVHTVYEGHLSSALLEAGTEAAFELAGAREWRFGLLDCARVTSFDPDLRRAAGRLIASFRSLGGREAALTVGNSGLRMLASAVAFGTGLPIRVFDDLRSAEAYLRERGALY